MTIDLDRKEQNKNKVEFYGHCDNKTVFRVDYLYYKIVKFTNLSLDPNMFKPYIVLMRHFRAEINSDRITKLLGATN